MKKLLLALSSLAIAPFTAFAQMPADNPTPDQLGNFLAQEVCTQYLDTGVLVTDSGFEQLAVKVMAEYGPQSGLLLLDLYTQYKDSPEDIVNDPYIFPTAQSLFTAVIKNDACFQAFIEGEVFDKDKTADTPQQTPDDAVASER